MKPVEFKHQNIVFAEDQPEYNPLPALKIDSPSGEVVSCWKLTFKERIRVLIFGKVWLSLMSFNNPLTPSFLSVKRKEVYSHSDDLIVWYEKMFTSIRSKFKIKKTMEMLFGTQKQQLVTYKVKKSGCELNYKQNNCERFNMVKSCEFCPWEK